MKNTPVDHHLPLPEHKAEENGTCPKACARKPVGRIALVRPICFPIKKEKKTIYIYIYYIILYSILYYTILYYIVLYRIVLYYIILYYIMLYYMILYYIILYYNHVYTII